MSRIDRLDAIVDALEAVHGRGPWNWHTTRDPFQVLIGTVLSQRTRDESTDKAAIALFSRYPNPGAISRASPTDIEPLIRPANYYRTKARKIIEISRIIEERFGGRTPQNLDELCSLPGVGRKTASCTLLYGHGISRIPVDVHVMVISQRLGWTEKTEPDEIQKDLESKIPRGLWPKINELMVRHGQNICLTRKPRCGICPVTGHCRYYKSLKEVL